MLEHAANGAVGHLPLAGVRVLDLTRVLAGPHCTALLGDLGADVIKIEDPHAGDESRQWSPRDAQTSAAYVTVNRNKRGIVLDLKRPEGQSVARELSATCDVVVENFRPGTMEGWGLGYDELSISNATLVYCRVSAFGRHGPLASQPGYEAVMQAFSGIMSITGTADDDPVRCGVSFIDLGTGVFAAYAVLAALYQRRDTGRGQYIEASLLGTSLAMLGYHAQGYLMEGIVPERMGASHVALVPYRTYLCGDDKPVFLAAGNQGLWHRFCDAMAADDLRDDPLFATVALRLANREVVDARVGALVRQWKSDEFLDCLRSAGVPAARVNDVGEFMRHEQVRNGPFISTHRPDGGLRHMPLLGPVIEAPDLGVAIHRDPPDLGEHTVSILREIGMNSHRIEQLLADGVVQQT